MRRFAILAAAALGVLAVPGSAAASHSTPTDSTCTYAQNEPNHVTQGPATVYAETTPNGSGSSGTADAAAGACVDTATPTAGDFEGGTLEAGVGNDAISPGGGSGEYVVIDGDNANPDPADGYQGLSNYESGASRDANCTADGPDQGVAGSTNSGGCFGADGGPWVDLTAVPAPTPICGNTSGNSWDSTTRDGCSIP